MAKKKTPRRSRPPQPRIYKEIGVERAREIIGFRRATLYFVAGGPGSVHPNKDDSEAAAVHGEPYMNEAAQDMNMAVAKNRMIWRGTLRETALEYAIQDWKNTRENRTRRNPQFFEIDVDMMNRQAQWALGRN